MRSQRVSADLMMTEGSPGSATPRIFLAMLQPERTRAGRTSQTKSRVFTGEEDNTVPSVLYRRFPGEALVFDGAPGQHGEPPREQGNPGDGRDIGHVEGHRAPALEQH